MNIHKIAVITGTRAEYGLLKPLIDGLRDDSNFELQLIVTGSHLSPEFGLTYRCIEADGVPIAAKVEMLLSSDTPVGITKSMGLAFLGFADALERLQPEAVIVLGDRYEILCAAASAVVARVPVFHIHGGETTEGAIDEGFRHAITKLSYLHFTSTEAYRKRVIQMGESPERVFNTGALGIDNIKKLNLLSKAALERELDFQLDKEFFLVTFHPVTLEKNTARGQVEALLEALDSVTDTKIIFTKANADTGGRIINELIDEYVARNGDRCIAFISMGQLRYLSAMKYSSLVLGNSSSGLIEAPSFPVPTVNIGDRQTGRIRAESVIECEPYARSIREAIGKARSEKFRNSIAHTQNPYGDGRSAERIIEIIRSVSIPTPCKKKFFDIEL